MSSESDRLWERERSLNWHACLFWFAATLSNWISMETGSENWMHNNNNESELRRGEFARSFVRLEVATQTETINSNWRLSKPALQAVRRQRESEPSPRRSQREVKRERGALRESLMMASRRQSSAGVRRRDLNWSERNKRDRSTGGGNESETAKEWASMERASVSKGRECESELAKGYAKFGQVMNAMRSWRWRWFTYEKKRKDKENRWWCNCRKIQ